LQEWLSNAGVRWGLDAEHRQAWGMSSELADANQNTWSFGLQRLLLGYAQGGQSDAPEVWQERLGQAGVDGLDAPLIGGLLRWLQAMTHSLHLLTQPHTPTEWVQLLQALVQRFFKATDEPTQRLLDRVLAPLEDWLSDCQLAGFDSPLPLTVVRTHWLAQMDAIGFTAPLHGWWRAICHPHAHACHSLQSGMPLRYERWRLPRSPAPRDFDLMGHTGLGRAGDRARREDDRYLFLEAVLSARQRLYVSWQGRRASDHAELPPSVLVGQLMDYLNRVSPSLATNIPCVSSTITTTTAFLDTIF
jgi:exodeoxyribonuclease V gamma subunit